MQTKPKRFEGDWTPKELAYSEVLDFLYYRIKNDDFAPNDTESYRKRVREQMAKLLQKLGDASKLDYSIPYPF